MPSSVPDELHDLRWQGPASPRWELARLLFIHLDVFQEATKFFESVTYWDYNAWGSGGAVNYMDAMMHTLGMEGPASAPFQALTKLESNEDLCDVFAPDKGHYFGVVMHKPRALPLITAECSASHLSFIGAVLLTGAHYRALIRDHQTWSVYDDWRPVQPVSEDEAKALIQEHGRIALYSVKNKR